MDIHSMEAMEDTILSFTGAVILVTHDRYLLGRVADSLLRVHENRAEFRDGGYEEHQAWVDLDIEEEPRKVEEAEKEKPKAKEPSKPKEPTKAKDAPRSAPPPERKPQPIDRERQKTLKRWERKVKEAETQVGELEKKLAALGKDLAAMDPAHWEAFSAKLDTQRKLEMELAYAMSAWEEAQSALDAVTTPS
jgi:outer membrane biosynthesis protein TonB